MYPSIASFRFQGVQFMAGYSFLAAYWYISWGITIAVACVTMLLIYSIQDVDQKFKQAVEPETGKTHGVSYPFYWILSNGIYLIIGMLVFFALVFSWGAGDSIFPFLERYSPMTIPWGNYS